MRRIVCVLLLLLGCCSPAPPPWIPVGPQSVEGESQALVMCPAPIQWEPNWRVPVLVYAGPRDSIVLLYGSFTDVPELRWEQTVDNNYRLAWKRYVSPDHPDTEPALVTRIEALRLNQPPQVLDLNLMQDQN